jgi:hypothetical protein
LGANDGRWREQSATVNGRIDRSIERTEDRSVKTIRVIPRALHQMADDTKECVKVLKDAGIDAQAARQSDQGWWAIWIYEDGDFQRALAMLHNLKLPVVDGNSN